MPNFWLFSILPDKDCDVTLAQIISALKEQNIEARQGLCLPSDIKMTDGNFERIIAVVQSCF